MDDLDFHLMRNFVLLARRQKSDAENAQMEFMKVLQDERYVSLRYLRLLLYLSIKSH
jgi:hypothetical protein